MNRVLQLPPSIVHTIYQEWSARMAARIAIYRKWNSLWENEYWKERGVAGDRYEDKGNKDGAIVVEVNRIYGYINSYVGSLFPQKLHAKFEDSDDGMGDAAKTGRVMNRWLKRRQIATRMTRAQRWALFHDGAGVKVVMDPKRKRVKDRVRCHVVPWWEMLLDDSVHDTDHQRYIGHVYHIPLAEAQTRFRDTTLKGAVRLDPMDPATPAGTPDPKTQDERGSQRFVKVVEWYNFVDPYTVGEADPDTSRPFPEWEPMVDETTKAPIESTGRFEVYLPDEEGAWAAPREVHPLPDVDSVGEALPPLHVLIFCEKMGYPLRGMSSVERVYDQFREMILLRSMYANSSKRNARQILLPEGWELKDNGDLVKRGVDGAIVYYTQPAESAGINIAQVMSKLDFGNLPADNERYTGMVETDLGQGGLMAPFTRGVATGASATEVNKLDSYGATEIGQMAMSFGMFLEGVLRHAQFAYVRALRKDGADATVWVKVKGERVPVTAADMYGDFDVEVQPGPASRAEADQQRQRTLAVLPVIAQIMQGVEQGNPAAIVLLDWIVELFELPDELRFKAIQAKMKGMKIQAQPGVTTPGSGNLPVPEMVNGAGGAQGEVPMPRGEQPAEVVNGTAQNSGASGTMSVEA